MGRSAAQVARAVHRHAPVPGDPDQPAGSPFTGGGDSAITAVQVTVDDNTGTPSCTGSVQDGVLKLAFKNLNFTKGAAVPNGGGGDAAAAIATVNALLASLRAGGVLNAMRPNGPVR